MRVALARLLPSERLLRSTAALALGTAGGQALVLLAAPALTRLYDPADFGLLAVYGAILALLAVIASLRYELAIPLAEDDGDALHLLALALLVVAAVSGLVALLAIPFAAPLLRLLGAEGLLPWTWLLPLSLAGAGAYAALSYWAIRRGAFGVLGRTRVTRGLAQVGLQLGAGLLAAGPLGLLAGDAAGRAAGSGALLELLRGDRRPRGFRLSFGRLRRLAGRYRRFPLFASGAALLSTASLQLPDLLFIALYGVPVGGLLALTYRVVGMPLTLVGGAVAQVYVGEAAALLRGGERPALRRLFLGTSGRMLLLAAIPALPLLLAGPPLFEAVFGEAWRAAGRFAQLLAPMFAVQFAVFPVAETLDLLERQKLRLAWDALRLVGVLGVLFVAWRLGWGAPRAVAAYGAAMAAGYALLFALSWWALDRRGSPA